MKISVKLTVVFVLSCLIAGFTFHDDEWGFFGHRRINRLAVFTLPEEMLPLFKTNIDFLTEHAVDPDKRRYAFRLEAPRHYLDMDIYRGKCLSRNFAEAFSSFAQLCFITATNDSLKIRVADTSWCNGLKYATLTDGIRQWSCPKSLVRSRFNSFVLPAYYDLRYIIPPDSVRSLLPAGAPDILSVVLIDHFTEHGIVPYIIEQQYNKLVKAFRAGNRDDIINTAADLGHYIGDAHVPLHACSNYNGQKTDQYGIHAFWESRLPELFADVQYDYLVGKAQYIGDVRGFAWETIEASGALADSVLLIEADLRSFYPKDQQMCFDQRLGQSVWIQCREYAAAYQLRMNGMVEARMRQAILGVGSLWYSAWIEAGSPDLKLNSDIRASWIPDSNVIKYDQLIQNGSKGFGRDHE